jgi:hypothetical protein
MSKLHMEAAPQPVRPAALRLADLVCLAATPAFAVMAVISGMGEGGPAHAGHHGSPLDGMVLMYALMAVFHSAPWLRLGSRR